VSTKKLNVYTTKEEFLENEVRTLTHHIASMIDTMKVMSMNRQHMLEEIERMKSEAKASVLEEREACAKVCDAFESDADPDAGAVLAKAIRSRGQTS
jgi:hypothetical protein